MPAEHLGSGEPLPREALEQAADWLLRLHDDDSPGTRAACERWCAQHPDHARAWQRARHLQALVAQVPGDWALPVLGRPQDRQRRAAIKRIGLWMTLVPGAWLGWQMVARPSPGQAERTAIGERRRVILPDGSALWLDTDTEVRVEVDPLHRRLRLERGQLQVDTAVDRHAPARPFEVVTVHGRVRALRTRFNVRLSPHRTRLALFDGVLEIHAGTRPAWRLASGQQAWFDTAGRHASEALDASVAAWTKGMLEVDARPLGEVLAALSRYRRGVLRCDPRIAAMPVSGAYPLDDSERSLGLLEATYPVRIHRSAGGWWVMVAPR